MNNALLEKFLVQPSVSSSPKRVTPLYALAKKHIIQQTGTKKEALSSSVDTIIYGISR